MPVEVSSSEILNPKKSRSASKGLILLVVGIIILVAIVVFLVFTILSTTSETWYAVYVTNGQMYFGHIAKEDAKSVLLKDVYYLQVQQVAAAEEGQEAQSQLSVFKLGDQEVYGPQNQMRINWDHIIFIEPLKGDSQVVATIEQMP